MRLLPRSRPFEGFLRGVGLVAVFGLAALLFSWHFERKARMIESQQSIWDQTGALSEKQKEFIRGFARSLKSGYGFDFRLWVRPGPAEAPEPRPMTAFLGVYPEAREVVVSFPPLLARGLGEGFVHDLSRTYFDGRWDDGSWPDGVSLALIGIWEKLQAMEETSDGPGGKR